MGVNVFSGEMWGRVRFVGIAEARVLEDKGVTQPHQVTHQTAFPPEMVAHGVGKGISPTHAHFCTLVTRVAPLSSRK